MVELSSGINLTGITNTSGINLTGITNTSGYNQEYNQV